MSAPAQAPSAPMGAWPALPAELAETAVTPADREYAMLRSSYMRVGSPGLVLRPHDADGVAAALVHAGSVRRETGGRVPVSVRSGGHGISGASTNDV